MNVSNSIGSDALDSAQRRPPRDPGDQPRAKRAKYTTAACNECKRCKVKCIRMGEDKDCQRCSTMRVDCIIVPTATQSAKDTNRGRKRRPSHEDSRQNKLSDEIVSLRQQIAALTASISTLIDQQSRPLPAVHNLEPNSSLTSPATSASLAQRPIAPQQPQFVGPTRSDYSFNIAEKSLSHMGIPTNDAISTGPSSTASSRTSSPADSRGDPAQIKGDILLNYSCDEITRLLDIYEEEIACVHPIIKTQDLIRDAPEILDFVKNPDHATKMSPIVGWKDAHILKVAIATSLLHETHGKNELSDRLVESVERVVGVVSLASEVELKDIQIMGMLSLYFCHTAEELFAWRAIGRAARQTLEMGLHRKQSLFDNFKDDKARSMAVQIFWVVYELDRRWSFGTSLSFALDDRDIDPALPEPGKDHPYLKAMVAYARICSRVWEALPPYGSPLELIAKETEDYLDFITQNWLESVPQELHFKHPRLGLAPQTQPRQLHRLRTLLYLRGNYLRMLIHRHHVLSPDNIRANFRNARLVVDIAKDSIHVLVHLNETSDIYIREQSIYHYYLLSALAVVLLAVCHAPHIFAGDCRDQFISAVELVKGFSRHSTASRRLWKSLRGLLPVIKSLARRASGGIHDSQSTEKTLNENNQHPVPSEQQQWQMLSAEPFPSDRPTTWANAGSTFDSDFGNTMPEISDMSNELMGLYNVFGAGAVEQSLHDGPSTDNNGEQGLSMWEIGEISRHFQGLI